MTLPRSFAAAWLLSALSLFSADVLVHLGVLDHELSGERSIARPADFFGVLAMDAVAAALAVAVTAAAAWTMARFARHGGREVWFVRLLAAALVGCAVMQGLAPLWRGRPHALRWAAVLAAVGAVVALAALPRLRLARSTAAGAPPLVPLLLALPFLAGTVLAAAAPAPQPVRASAVAALPIAALALLPSALAPARERLRAIGWLVPGAATAVALLLCTRSAFVGAGPPLAAEAGARGPSIALVVLDTVRADRLDLYGYPRPTMPNLAAWAEDAVVFRRAVSPAGWTTAAHASLFSGRTVSGHGVHYAARNGFRTEAFIGIAWLPQLLRERGYATLAVSANPLALPAAELGFDRVVVPHRGIWRENSTFALLASRVLPIPGLDRAGVALRWREPHADARVVTRTLRHALEGASGPLFVFVNLMDAHSPYNPPAFALRALGSQPEPPFAIRHEFHQDLTRRWPELRADERAAVGDLYDAELRALDAELARLLAVLEDLGEGSATIVTADHGEELGEAGRVGHEYGLAQALVHVPLVVRAPDASRGWDEAPVTTRRLFHLVLALAQGDPRPLDHLRETDPDGLLSERYPSGQYTRRLGDGYDRHWLSLVERDLKAVASPPSTFRLYDVARHGFDHEMPVAASRAPRLRERLETYWGRHRDRREEQEARPESAAEHERLRALGYVD